MTSKPGWNSPLNTAFSRRGLKHLALGALGLAGIANAEPSGAKRKKKRKKKAPQSQPPPGRCGVQYLDCHGECRLIGACCDGKPGYDCAERHAGEDGRWICCEFAGFGCRDLESDKFSCGACGTVCDENEICCSGACRLGPGPCLPG